MSPKGSADFTLLIYHDNPREYFKLCDFYLLFWISQIRTYLITKNSKF